MYHNGLMCLIMHFLRQKSLDFLRKKLSEKALFYAVFRAEIPIKKCPISRCFYYTERSDGTDGECQGNTIRKNIQKELSEN